MSINDALSREPDFSFRDKKADTFDFDKALAGAVTQPITVAPKPEVAPVTQVVPVAQTVQPTSARPQQAYVRDPLENRPISYLSVASLILALTVIVSLFAFHVFALFIAIPGTLLSIIFGHVGLHRARKYMQRGRGLAITGFILGYLQLLGYLLIAVLAVIVIVVLGGSLVNGTLQDILNLFPKP